MAQTLFEHVGHLIKHRCRILLQDEDVPTAAPLEGRGKTLVATFLRRGEGRTGRCASGCSTNVP